MTDTLLVIEDEVLLGEELRRRYRRQGWDVVLADSLTTARRYLIDEPLAPLVVLSDLNLPDGNALSLLESLQQQDPPVDRGGEWVFLTGVGGIPDSVRALRLGAFDFIEKPADLEHLDLIIAGAARSSRAQRRLREQSNDRGRRYTVESAATTSSSRVMTHCLFCRPWPRWPAAAGCCPSRSGTAIRSPCWA